MQHFCDLLMTCILLFWHYDTMSHMFMQYAAGVYINEWDESVQLICQQALSMQAANKHWRLCGFHLYFLIYSENASGC